MGSERRLECWAPKKGRNGSCLEPDHNWPGLQEAGPGLWRALGRGVGRFLGGQGAHGGRQPRAGRGAPPHLCPALKGKGGVPYENETAHTIPLEEARKKCLLGQFIA